MPAPPPVGARSHQPIVVFERVEFADNRRRVLQGVNLQGSTGEFVAMTGRSGTGRSTIAHLIPGLHDVSAGSVMPHGVDVRELPLADLCRRVALVPQETFLFSANEMLTYGLIGILADG